MQAKNGLRRRPNKLSFVIPSKAGPFAKRVIWCSRETRFSQLLGETQKTLNRKVREGSIKHAEKVLCSILPLAAFAGCAVKGFLLDL
jgi:hypothetical protein